MTDASLSERLARDFAADPGLYPHSLDIENGRVLIVDMPWPELREASFLDERVLQTRPSGGWTGEPDFLALAAQAPRAEGLGFIFHVGHCGSTLISRLLAGRGDAGALREPQPLRALAEAEIDRDTAWDPISPARRDALFDGLLRSWARKPDGASRVIVKATSLTSGLAPELLSRAPDAPALSLSMALEPYLAALLAPDPPSADLPRGARIRFSRLTRELGADPGWRLHALSPGELAAASWIAERHTLARLERARAERVKSVDFDAFLAAPADGLLEIARHMGLDWTAEDAAAAVGSDVMRRYAKAREHSYDAEFRTRVLEDSRSRNAGEIAKGRAFAEAAIARLGLGDLIAA